MASHHVVGRKLSRYGDQRVALLRNLVVDLVDHGRITTTLAKAKETRVLAERIITHGKKGGLHQRRLALATLPDEKIVKKVFDELAPKYAQRSGGYTRIVKLGPRRGDAAEMAVIELV